MREIKFRAVNNTDKKMYYSDKIGISNFFMQLEHGILDKETLGQFTGHKDKNGKEIYEGDITAIAKSYGKIEWDNDKLQYYVKWDFGVYEELCEWKNSSNVVGNIYENPELLKYDKKGV